MPTPILYHEGSSTDRVWNVQGPSHESGALK